MSVQGNPKPGIAPLERVRSVVAFSDDVAFPPLSLSRVPSWTSRGSAGLRPNNPPPFVPVLRRLSLIGLVSQPLSRTTDLLPATPRWILERYPDTLVASFGIASRKSPSATTLHRKKTIMRRLINAECFLRT